MQAGSARQNCSLKSRAYGYATNGPQRAPWARTLLSGQAHALPAIGMVGDSGEKRPLLSQAKEGWKQPPSRIVDTLSATTSLPPTWIYCLITAQPASQAGIFIQAVCRGCGWDAFGSCHKHLPKSGSTRRTGHRPLPPSRNALDSLPCAKAHRPRCYCSCQAERRREAGEGKGTKCRSGARAKLFRLSLRPRRMKLWTRSTREQPAHQCLCRPALPLGHFSYRLHFQLSILNQFFIFREFLVQVCKRLNSPPPGPRTMLLFLLSRGH